MGFVESGCPVMFRNLGKVGVFEKMKIIYFYECDQNEKYGISEGYGLEKS
jgi:hypothetical protein